MSIEIVEKKCVACGKCMDLCPGSLLKRTKEGKATIKRTQDCWGCAACVKICPTDAIALLYQEAQGGDGSRLYAKTAKDGYLWKAECQNGTDTEIFTSSKEANSY